MPTPFALDLIPYRSYETSVSFSIRLAVFLAGGWAVLGFNGIMAGF
jgi:hypothetical protein